MALAARREDRLNTLVADLGEKTLAVPTDVTDPAACSALVSRTVERFGALDILVNNAGLGLYAPIHKGDPEDWRAMFDVNVLGVLYVTRATARQTLEQGAGDIVFVSSVAGRRVPRADGAVYAATKHAVSAVAEGLRMDLNDRGIRVTVVEPGLVRAGFPESSYPNVEEYYAGKEHAPLEAEDVAAAVLFAVEQPPRVSVDEILVRPTEQAK